MRTLKYTWKIYVMFILMFAACVVATIFMPHDSDLLGQVGSCEVIDRNIACDNEKGEFKELTRLPYHYSIPKGKLEELSVKLFKMQDGQEVFIYTDGIDTDVYLDEQRVVSVHSQNGDNEKKWIHIPVSAKNSAQTLKIVIRSPKSDKKGTIEKIYIGNRGVVIGRILYSYLPLIISGFLIIMMGLVIIVYDMITRWFDFVFAGLSMLLYGLWLIAMPQIRQMYTQNLMLSDRLRHVMYIAVVIAFVIAIYEMRGHYKERLVKSATVVYFATFAVSTILRYVQPNSNLYLNVQCCGFACVCVAFVRQFIMYMNTYRHEQYAAMLQSKEKDEFLANVSHAIRTPVNTIVGMNSMIQRKTKDDMTRAYSDEIGNAAESLVSIIDDILDMSKISNGTPELVCAEYNIGDLISACYNMILFKTTSKYLSFEISNDPDIPLQLIGDESRIRQILVNLLMNAAKYTNTGGIKLKIGYRPVAQDSIILDFDVSDTGIGIKKEDLSHIFESFERIGNEKSQAEEGNGLGLQIVKSFVDLMGGSIDVESEYGKGSSFKVSIPQRYKGSQKIGDCSEKIRKVHEQKEAPIKWFKAPGARILVVDDVEMNIRVITELLGRTQMNIDTADNGSRALELIASKRYDIIFLDHMMPVMDGIETFHKIKELDLNPNFDTPVIMLTANAIKGAKDEYLHDGFSDYLAKPVSENDLVTVCRKHLSQGLVFDDNDDMQKEELPGGERDDILNALSSVVNVDEGMMYCVNNRDFYIEMLSDYTKSECISKLEKNFSENDFDNYRINVHSIKSTARTLGADDISEEAKALESAAKSGDLEYIRKNHGKLIADNEDLVSQITSIISSEEGSKEEKPKHEITDDHLRALLTSASKCAYIFDIDGVEKAVDELKQSILTDEMEEKLEELLNAINEIEFEDMIRMTADMISLIKS